MITWYRITWEWSYQLDLWNSIPAQSFKRTSPVFHPLHPAIDRVCPRGMVRPTSLPTWSVCFSMSCMVGISSAGRCSLISCDFACSANPCKLQSMSGSGLSGGRIASPNMCENQSARLSDQMRECIACLGLYYTLPPSHFRASSGRRFGFMTLCVASETKMSEKQNDFCPKSGTFRLTDMEMNWHEKERKGSGRKGWICIYF